MPAVTPELATFSGQAWDVNPAWQAQTDGARLTAVETAIASMAMPRYARNGLVSNSSGVWTGNLGANVFAQQPVIQVIPKMAAGSWDWRYQVTGSAAAGFTVTVTFTLRKNTIDISLGALLNVPLIESGPGVVTFDLLAADRTT